MTSVLRHRFCWRLLFLGVVTAKVGVIVVLSVSPFQLIVVISCTKAATLMNQNRFHSLGIRAVKVTVLIVTAITLGAFKSGIVSIHFKVHQGKRGTVLREGGSIVAQTCSSKAGIFISHCPELSSRSQREGKHGGGETSAVQFQLKLPQLLLEVILVWELQLSKSFFFVCFFTWDQINNVSNERGT